MSQDKDDTQSFTDSSGDERFDISTASSENSEKITDEDSSKSNSEVDDNQADDKGQCASEISRPISLSIDLHDSNPQNSSKLIEEPCLSIKAVKQADVHQQVKIPGTPTKRRFPFLNEDSTTNTDFKRSTISSSSKQKAEDFENNNFIESNLPLTPAVITPEKFEKEFTKIADEENKNNQNPSQRTEFDSQNPTTERIERQREAYSSVSAADKQVNIHKETRTSETATKLGLLSSNDNSESRSDPEKQVSSIKPYEEVERDATITATTELNLPPPRIFISQEYFKTVFSKVFEEYNKRNSQLSSQQPKFFSQNPSSQSPQKQMDCPSSTSDAPKQINIQQETKFPGNSTKLGYRSLEELLDCPTNRRDPLFDEDLESQPSSEILSNSDENDEVSSAATVDLNLPPSKFIFSPSRFAREFSRISHDLNKENSKLSSRKPHTWPGDPCSSKQSDTQHGEKMPKTPQKRRLSSEENSGLQPDSKKYIASTRPVAKVKGRARTTSSELQLPSSRDVFAPERFEQEFAKQTGLINKQNTQHSSQGSSLQNKDPRLRNVIWNPFLTIKLKNPPINSSSDSQIDQGEGPSHSRSDVEQPESPISESQSGGINFSEIDNLMNRLHSENLKNRRLEIATRLSTLADHIKEFRNLLNAMSLAPIIPPSHLTRSHSLQARRDLARRYHGATIAERQLFLSQQPSIEILSTFVTGMTDILNDIRYDLSVATYNAWMFKDRVEYLITQFRQNFCVEDVKKKKKDKSNNEPGKIVNGENGQKETDEHNNVDDRAGDQKIVNGETDQKKTDEHNNEDDEDCEDDQKIEIKLYKDFYNIFLKFSKDVEELFKGLDP